MTNTMAGRKYTKEILEPIVAQSVSWAQVIRALGLPSGGGSYSNIQMTVKTLKIDHSHFTGQGHMKGKCASGKKHWSGYLVTRPPGSRKVDSARLRRAMLEAGFVYQCCFDECPTRKGWINGSITFEIDHINGNNIDNERSNLRFICPNCHSQQLTSSHSWKNSERYGKSKICNCGGKKRSRSTRCLKCHTEYRSLKSILRKEKQLLDKSKRDKSTKARKTKIDWPPIDELKTIVKETNYRQAGKILGVSDNAIRRHMRKYPDN